MIHFFKFIIYIFSGGSEDGPWTVKLNYKIGEKFLEYCSDRDIRYMIWFAEDKAGSINETARELANSVCLEEIRTLRYVCSVQYYLNSVIFRIFLRTIH